LAEIQKFLNVFLKQFGLVGLFPVKLTLPEPGEALARAEGYAAFFQALGVLVADQNRSLLGTLPPQFRTGVFGNSALGALAAEAAEVGAAIERAVRSIDDSIQDAAGAKFVKARVVAVCHKRLEAFLAPISAKEVVEFIGLPDDEGARRARTHTLTELGVSHTIGMMSQLFEPVPVPPAAGAGQAGLEGWDQGGWHWQPYQQPGWERRRRQRGDKGTKGGEDPKGAGKGAIGGKDPKGAGKGATAPLVQTTDADKAALAAIVEKGAVALSGPDLATCVRVLGRAPRAHEGHFTYVVNNNGVFRYHDAPVPAPQQ